MRARKSRLRACETWYQPARAWQPLLCALTSPVLVRARGGRGRRRLLFRWVSQGLCKRNDWAAALKRSRVHCPLWLCYASIVAACRQRSSSVPHRVGLALCSCLHTCTAGAVCASGPTVLCLLTRNYAAYAHACAQARTALPVLARACKPNWQRDKFLLQDFLQKFPGTSLIT